MYNDLLYQIALTRVPQVGDVHAKNLAQVYGSAEAVFKAPKHQLEKLEGIGSIRAKNIKAFTQFKDGETEIAFLEKYHIAPLFITHPNYPKRLINCYDRPPLLYYKGNADLNSSKII
ncbi:MAG TPA: helix-hairpin-helix domain-containing protein, partial [Ferruginibacter sp.]|nr:helix-hairpin-helix domain-containing protein [Ferruginibacter sp.]